jgi:hypothetical protein
MTDWAPVRGRIEATRPVRDGAHHLGGQDTTRARQAPRLLRTVAFHPDGRILAGGTDTTISLWTMTGRGSG